MKRRIDIENNWFRTWDISLANLWLLVILMVLPTFLTLLLIFFTTTKEIEVCQKCGKALGGKHGKRTDGGADAKKTPND